MNENKFNGMGKIYSKYRPSYPINFIDYLFTDVGISQSSIIADIGSGTGILTGQLLEKGGRVYGVEPNDDMRAIAETNLSNFFGFTSVNGNADDTTIDDNSVDYITVAQAFHWFDYETKVFSNDLIFDMDGFIGRNLSASYSLKSNDEQYNDYINELKKIYEKYSHKGQLIMPNLTRSYVGDV